MKKTILSLVILLTATFSFGQRLKVEQGSLKNLKEIRGYSLEFDYSDLKIPKYNSEEEFLEDKMAKREKKKPGLGEKFKKSWFADRVNRYEPKFIESFNKRFKNGEIEVGKNLNAAKYVFKIHTTKLYAGYNVGIIRHNAEIDITITVYEKSAPDNILFLGSYKDVQGRGAMGNDYNSGYRISECYAKLAKVFAKDLKKKIKQ